MVVVTMPRRRQLSQLQHLVLVILGEAGIPLSTQQVGQQLSAMQQKRRKTSPTVAARRTLQSLKILEMVSDCPRERDVVWVLTEF
jgi:hypothetical protein